MATQKYYEGQEFRNPNDPKAPILVYKAGKFIPKPTAATVNVNPEQVQAARVMMNALDTAEDQTGMFSTGVLGGIGAKIPGSPGYNLDRTTDTIKGNLSFGKLMQMKASSPTGASGLGALSEGENRMLQSLAGSLDVGQSTPQFRENLKRVRNYVAESTPGVSMDNPIDLSAGQTRETLPRGVYYRDQQGNVRRNDNGDKGNPILRPKGGSAAPAVKKDAARPSLADIFGG
jgi:hypothetical protein